MGFTEYMYKGVGGGSIPLHHAYCLVGDREKVCAELSLFLKEAIRFDTKGNPDFYGGYFETLSVEDSRRVRDVSERKALGGRKIFILAFNTATSEAQNALLKVLEEPTPRTHFFLIVPRQDFLLPTLLSRVFVIHSDLADQETLEDFTNDFLSSSVPDRLKIAKQIAEEVSDGEKSKQFVIEFLGRIERTFYSRRKKEQIPISIFEDIALARKYAGDRSASIKVLLEHLALVLPHLPLTT